MLPITILMVLLSDIRHLRAELEVMNDFMSFEPNEHESEKRLLTNLTVRPVLFRNPTTLFAGIGKLIDRYFRLTVLFKLMELSNRRGFVEQFCEWTDDDLEAFAEQSDYSSLVKLLGVLSEEVHLKATRLQHHKEAIVQVEDEIGNAHKNL